MRGPVSSSNARVKRRKAWLVTWEWAGSHAAVSEDEKVAAVLRPQLSPESITRIVEILYGMREYSPVDKLAALDYNPYPANFGTTVVRSRVLGEQRIIDTGQIVCGHNPYLYARLVDNLHLLNSSRPEQGLVWDERERPELTID